MPYFKYEPKFGFSYYWEVPYEERTYDAGTSSCASMSEEKGQNSDSFHRTKYQKLPHYLKSCLDYCALLSSMWRDWRILCCWMKERRMVARLMVAEGLIENKAGETNVSSLEDTASSYIDELIGLEMLVQEVICLYDISITKIDVAEPYYKLCVFESEKQDFQARNVVSPIRMFIGRNDIKISSYCQNFPIQSLFFFNLAGHISQTTMDTILGINSLVVLALASWTDERIEHFNLRFLRFDNLFSRRKILPNLGNFPCLQTLEFTDLLCEFPERVLHIRTLRHLSLVDARCDNIGELSRLSKLQHLCVHFVCPETIGELLKAIMALENLISLFMKAEFCYFRDEFIRIFPHMEPFSPPPLIQELQLSGNLMELPVWIANLKNLTTLNLIASNLSDYPADILQNLPKLKHLCLNHAYNAKLIGEDFCSAEGFPRLQSLEIRSTFLIEWTEIVAGGFPCLSHFGFTIVEN